MKVEGNTKLVTHKIVTNFVVLMAVKQFYKSMQEFVFWSKKMLLLKYIYSQFNLPDVNKIDFPSLLVKTRIAGLPPM